MTVLILTVLIPTVLIPTVLILTVLIRYGGPSPPGLPPVAAVAPGLVGLASSRQFALLGAGVLAPLFAAVLAPLFAAVLAVVLAGLPQHRDLCLEIGQ
jgi:hypothetical protein